MFSLRASKARVKHINHWRPPAVYLQLYTLQPSLYFIIWEYIYYINFFCVPVWKIVVCIVQLPSGMNCFFSCLPKADTQADKLTRLILKPVALLTFTTMVHLCHSFLAAQSGNISTYWQGLRAQLEPAEDRCLLQHTLLLALCLYNNHHRAFTWETFYERMVLTAITTVCYLLPVGG